MAFLDWRAPRSLLTNPDRDPRQMFRAIATDIHFWIPLGVLAGGLFLLDKLR